MTNKGSLKLTTPGDREIAMTRVFDAPRRLVFEAWTKPDEAWYVGGAVGTIVLVEDGDRTTLTQTLFYESRETRDAVLKSPMEQGVAMSYDKLDEVLVSLEA